MNESSIFGVSIRAILVFMLTLTVCALTSYIVIHFKITDKIPEPLYSAFMLALGFFFGQKTQQTTNGGPNAQISSTTLTTVTPAPDKSPSPGTDIKP